MSTRLGHTRYRVWIIPLVGGGFFEVQWRERPEVSPHGPWFNRKVESGLAHNKAVTQREAWIEEALRLHAEEHGLPSPAHIDQRVEKTRVKGKVKPTQRGLF